MGWHPPASVAHGRALPVHPRSPAAPGRVPGETMATQQDQPEPVAEGQERGRLDLVIRNGVLSGLGRPRGLSHVQVKCLWDGRYRVNVFVGADVVSATVAHSYFLETDRAGKILSSSPPITRVH